MFTVTERIYRTSDGRLVRHGDPAAAFLAYPVGTELSDDEARRFGVAAFHAEQVEPPAEKATSQVANKMAGPPAGNKSRKEGTP